MDALNELEKTATVAAGVAAPALPPESPVAMPEHSLSRFDKAKERRKSLTRHIAPWLSRLVAFGGGFALTGWGAYEMYRVVDVGGITFLKWVLLVLFVANFSWIALAFTAGIVGFVHLLFKRPKPPAPPQQLEKRTAVVMPI